MTVLLVEDDLAIRLTLAEYMEDAGLQVLEAGDAVSALSLLNMPAHNVRVLVTDLNLGPGDSGLVLAAKARRRLKHLRIFYVTGSPHMLHARRLRPWERTFIKPFDICRLTDDVRALHEALGLAGTIACPV